ncbi:MAG: hypothetical protein M1819_002112 [Sarea resinae]|nr:MAG: hypothetical protein M1819_002112 [Sarea resinae]
MCLGPKESGGPELRIPRGEYRAVFAEREYKKWYNQRKQEIRVNSIRIASISARDLQANDTDKEVEDSENSALVQAARQLEKILRRRSDPTRSGKVLDP